MNLQLPTLLSSVHCTVPPYFSLYSLEKSLTVAHSRMSFSALDYSLKTVVIACMHLCAILRRSVCGESFLALQNSPVLSTIFLTITSSQSSSLSHTSLCSPHSHPHPFAPHSCSSRPNHILTLLTLT